MSSRALRVHGPRQFALDGQAPRTLEDNEVRVQVSYAGICHTDQYILTGRHPAVSYPLVPGHEISGTIAEVGRGVGGFGPGEAVAVLSTLSCGRCQACLGGRDRLCRAPRYFGTTEDGGWQEELVVPDRAVRSLAGTGLSLLEAVLLEPAANAHAAIEAARVLGDENVVVIGPGPIGLLAAQQARAAGAGSVIVVGLPADEDRLARARRLGADRAVALEPGEDPAQARSLLREALGDEHIDVVVQCAGTLDATRLALSVIDKTGRVIIEGFAGSARRIGVSPDMITTQSLTIAGVNGWTANDFDTALQQARQGIIHLGSLVTDTFVIDDYQKALKRAVSGRAIKVAFSPQPSEDGDHG